MLSLSWDAPSPSIRSGFFKTTLKRLSCYSTPTAQDARLDPPLLRVSDPRFLPSSLKKTVVPSIRTFPASANRANSEVDMLDKQTRGAILLLREKGHSLHRISRLLSLSLNSVRKVVRIGSEEPPIIHRPCKLDAHRERIVQMLAEFDGNVAKVHRALADAGTTFRYSALTRFCRKNHLLDRASDPRRPIAALRQWLMELTSEPHAVERLKFQLPHAADLLFLLSQLKHGRSRHRKKAATILARQQGISNSMIAAALRSSRKTTRRYYKMYVEEGLEKLFSWNTNRHVGANAQLPDQTKRILDMIHHQPTAFGINRTSWTQPALLKAYQQSYGEIISRRTLTRILRSAGCRWRKARRVLTSPDPLYHEKVELLLNTLHSLGENEMFFFLDEWGPTQVRKRGGQAYRDDRATIPRHQASRGNVSLIAAVSATTNQVTWCFLETKDSQAMIDVIEVLYNQYRTKTKLYVTWDAVAWHNSGALREALDQFNEETRALSVGPVIELVPLPTSSQFLNVIEGVLSGMTRAVINNSDYPDTAQMKQAISRHFTERNEHFRDNPKRVGKRIWELDFFKDFDALRAGTYKEG
jgi:transposase